MTDPKTPTQKTSPAKDATTRSYVPLGWIAFLFGILSIAASLLSRLDLLPRTEFPVGGLGIALLVGGYIACFIIPSLDRRITELEDRIHKIEKKSDEKARAQADDDVSTA